MTKDFTITLNRPMAYAQLAVAVMLGVATAVYVILGETTIIIVFGFVAVANAILAVGGLRSYLTLQGNTLIAHTYYRHQVIELKDLTKAHVVRSRAGPMLVLQNTAGQSARFVLPTNNKVGIRQLADRLKSPVMANGVNRDKRMIQVIEKYAS